MCLQRDLQVETWAVKVKASLNSCKSYVSLATCKLSLHRLHLLLLIQSAACESAPADVQMVQLTDKGITYAVYVCDFILVTCPGQGWTQRRCHDTGHSAALPLMDWRTHTAQSDSHSHDGMLPWDGSHTPHTRSGLERGRNLGRYKIHMVISEKHIVNYN